MLPETDETAKRQQGPGSAHVINECRAITLIEELDRAIARAAQQIAKCSAAKELLRQYPQLEAQFRAINAALFF